ncbi:MAG: hypothetical protein PVH87_14445 [Desulfobacteraceae bacterium]
MMFKTYYYTILAAAGLLSMGCTAHIGKTHITFPEDCIERLERQMKNAPKKHYLLTMDGQKVPLDQFFLKCHVHMPVCSLPEKFYHWKNEVKTVTSKTEHGKVTHKVRIYYNYLSTCKPDQIDPEKTHGDIAEFYDAKGEFMGLAVYAGNGLYFPLPYDNYSGREKLQLHLKDPAQHLLNPAPARFGFGRFRWPEA